MYLSIKKTLGIFFCVEIKMFHYFLLAYETSYNINYEKQYFLFTVMEQKYYQDRH